MLLRYTIFFGLLSLITIRVAAQGKVVQVRWTAPADSNKTLNHSTTAIIQKDEMNPSGKSNFSTQAVSGNKYSLGAYPAALVGACPASEPAERKDGDKEKLEH